jgi:hypothetical protein
MATYYDLFIKCPTGHLHYANSSPSYWYHAGCGAKMQIGDDARLKCTSGHSSHLRNWRSLCYEHEMTYSPSGHGEFVNAIAVVGQMVKHAGKSWLLRLLDNMGADW